MNSPQRQDRRDIRYPLSLPVLLKQANKEMHARSENISVGGILLSSAFLIHEGSTVEVEVGIASVPSAGAQLTARGKILRVQPRPSGNFALAIAFEHPLKLGRHHLDPAPEGKGPQLPQEKNRVVTGRWVHFTPAWHTET